MLNFDYTTWSVLLHGWMSLVMASVYSVFRENDLWELGDLPFTLAQKQIFADCFCPCHLCVM